MKQRNLKRFFVIVLAMFTFTLSGCHNTHLYFGDETYQMYLKATANGYEGTYEEWLASLHGDDGKDGNTPYIGTNGNWWIGDEDTGIAATGPQGDVGNEGPKGEQGEQGDNGEVGDIGEQGEPGEKGVGGSGEDVVTGEELFTWTEMYIENLYEEIKATTVTIEVYSSADGFAYVPYSSASGVIVAEDDDFTYIYTNAHVVSYIYNRNVEFVSDVIFASGIRLEAFVVTLDLAEDVAVIKTERHSNNHYKIAKFGDSDAVKKGETIFALGSPISLIFEQTFTIGNVLNVNVPVTNTQTVHGYQRTVALLLIQVDAALNDGNSGGPLFNSKGELIAINTLKIDYFYSPLEGFNFALPIKHFKRVADYSIMHESNSYNRPTLLIDGTDLLLSSTIEKSENEKVNYDHGLLITYINENSINKDALQVDDIIVEMDGRLIRNVGDYFYILLEQTIGVAFPVVVLRDGVPLNVTLTPTRPIYS